MLVSLCSYICQPAWCRACLMLLISYFTRMTSVQPLRISLHICTPSYLLLGSEAPPPPPPPPLPSSREGNAPLIMGTCPPSWSRHLTSKQTFVGCRVIGAPASRCKLDTSLVTTNIATRGTEEQPHHQVITYNDQSALSLVFCHNRQPAPVRATSQPDLLEE